MDDGGGDTLILAQSAAPMPPLTRKGKARAKTRTLPDAKPGVPQEQQHNEAVPRGLASPYSFFEINSDGQPTAHNDVSDGSHQIQRAESSFEPPSLPPKRRGRPPKAASTQKSKPNAHKTVVPRPSTDRRPSASSVNSSFSAQADEPAQNSEKKTRLRARNREAAHKCRVRKQRGIEDLQTQEAAIGAVNQSLKNQYAELRSEVILLKDMVLQHGGCGCSYIESYIEDAAASLSQKSDSFTTGRHGSSSSGISPAASWSPASTQGHGFPTLEDGTGHPPQYDWDVMGGSMHYQEGGQMGSLSATHDGNFPMLELQDSVDWTGSSRIV
ncbi:hypothetical protein ACHAQH_003234 [Verticillium albo-atrum]